MTGENLKLIRNLKLGISTGEYITDLDINSLPKKWYYYILLLKLLWFRFYEHLQDF